MKNFHKGVKPVIQPIRAKKNTKNMNQRNVAGHIRLLGNLNSHGCGTKSECKICLEAFTRTNKQECMSNFVIGTDNFKKDVVRNHDKCEIHAFKAKPFVEEILWSSQLFGQLDHMSNWYFCLNLYTAVYVFFALFLEKMLVKPSLVSLYHCTFTSF